MKFLNSFNSFLKNRVNLDQTRVDKANATSDTLTTFLKNASETKALFVGTSRQGSLRQGTIIKPRKNDTEFDVDLLLEMFAVAGWRPSAYIRAVHDAFVASDRYKGMLNSRNKHRCETIEYAGDFHVDIVPMVRVNGQSWIMNRDSDEFEPTDGDGYAGWFAAQNARTGGQLVRVVRLAKYLRDEHEWPIKSILLTTMLGKRVAAGDGAATYPDVPTSLRVLLSRLDLWLQAQRSVPQVVNPALPTETFDRHWNEETFGQLRNGVHTISGLVEQAYTATERDLSAEKWQEAFGEAFPILEEDLEGGRELVKAQFALGTTTHVRPLSDIARAEHLTNKVRIDATVYNLAGKVRFQGINSGARISSGRAVFYRAKTNADEPFSVRWQVVNTGAHAASENGLRGGFHEGKNRKGDRAYKLENWETSRYTGRHWIECFIIKDDVCVARDRFIVDIKDPGH